MDTILRGLITYIYIAVIGHWKQPPPDSYMNTVLDGFMGYMEALLIADPWNYNEASRAELQQRLQKLPEGSPNILLDLLKNLPNTEVGTIAASMQAAAGMTVEATRPDSVQSQQAESEPAPKKPARKSAKKVGKKSDEKPAEEKPVSRRKKS